MLGSDAAAATGVALVVVAGGASRRMGSDKASLPVLGRPALLHLLHEASAIDLVARVVVVRRGQGLPTLPSDVVRANDPHEREGEGPLPALVTGLDALVDPAPGVVLVLATDAIGVRVEDLRQLLAALDGHEAAVPRSEGRWHPLVAAYAREPMRRALQTLMDAGERRLQALPDALDTVAVAPENMSATALTACNTPERWREAEAAISDAAGGRGPSG